MYIVPGQGQTTPWGQNFDANRNSLSLCPFVTSSKKKSLWSRIFLPFFICFFFHVYTAPGRDRQPIGDKNFMTTERPFLFAHMWQICKMISSKSDFIHTFNVFTYVYGPGERAENPLGTNFWCQQKALITSTICCKFQTNLFEFWFYTHILMFFNMYIAPGQGQTTICGQNPDVNRKALSLCPFVASLKKYLWSLILHIFFLALIFQEAQIP